MIQEQAPSATVVEAAVLTNYRRVTGMSWVLYSNVAD